jgi:hypothetical protein
MRINLKQRAVCACVVAATLALTMSEALAAGRGGAGGRRASAAAHGGKPTPGPGVAGGAALGSRPPVPGGWGGYPSRAARYGEFGVYGRRQQYGCGGGACGGGYWGGGGVYYGDGYYDPNYEVGPAAAGPYDYDPNYRVGLSAGPGYYDTYAAGRPAALTALPPIAPEYGMPGQRVIEVPATVTRTNLQAVAPSPAANPHIIELTPAK